MDFFESRGDIIFGDIFGRFLVAEIKHYAVGDAPFERHLFNKLCWTALRGWIEMVRRVQVSAQVATQLDLLGGKKRAVREMGNLHLIALGEYHGCLIVRDGVQFDKLRPVSSSPGDVIRFGCYRLANG